MDEIIFLGNFKGHGRNFGGATFGIGGVSPTILQRDYKDPKCVVVERSRVEVKLSNMEKQVADLQRQDLQIINNKVKR